MLQDAAWKAAGVTRQHAHAHAAAPRDAQVLSVEHEVPDQASQPEHSWRLQEPADEMSPFRGRASNLPWHADVMGAAQHGEHLVSRGRRSAVLPDLAASRPSSGDAWPGMELERLASSAMIASAAQHGSCAESQSSQQSIQQLAGEAPNVYDSEDMGSWLHQPEAHGEAAVPGSLGRPALPSHMQAQMGSPIGPLIPATGPGLALSSTSRAPDVPGHAPGVAWAPDQDVALQWKVTEAAESTGRRQAAGGAAALRQDADKLQAVLGAQGSAGKALQRADSSSAARVSPGHSPDVQHGASKNAMAVLQPAQNHSQDAAGLSCFAEQCGTAIQVPASEMGSRAALGGQARAVGSVQEVAASQAVWSQLSAVYSEADSFLEAAGGSCEGSSGSRHSQDAHSVHAAQDGLHVSASHDGGRYTASTGNPDNVTCSSAQSSERHGVMFAAVLSDAAARDGQHVPGNEGMNKHVQPASAAAPGDVEARAGLTVSPQHTAAQDTAIAQSGVATNMHKLLCSPCLCLKCVFDVAMLQEC